jgi:TRAP-type C4-dicarboxylate transport system permease small subunit
VSVDFVLEMVPPAARRWLERLGHVLGLAFTVIFLVQTWRLFTRHAASGARDISTLSIPLAPMSFVLPLGVALLAITYVFVLADSFLQPPGDPTLQDRERARAGPLLELE